MGVICFVMLLIWVFCFITSIYLDSLKKHKTQKQFRVYKRILSFFLFAVAFVLWLVSLDIGTKVMWIIDICLIVVASIILFVNVKNKDDFMDF